MCQALMKAMERVMSKVTCNYNKAWHHDVRGNTRCAGIQHGSGGSPWGYPTHPGSLSGTW